MQVNRHRIARNTLFLYARMVIGMLVSLFTSRVVLQTLGVEDFGTYSIVGGVVMLFSFVNDTMVGSIQRFLNFALGKSDDTSGVTETFTASMRAQAIVAAVVVLLAETVGLYYLNHHIKLPAGRLSAANWVYQLSVFSTAIGILSTPFTAAVVAHERMNVLAVVSIVNVFVKLAIVYALLIVPGDKLVAYALLSACVTVLTAAYYVHYTHSRLAYCRIVDTCNKRLLRSMMSFSGWNLFGSIARVASLQGVDLLLNHFHGVVVNAALAISNQVYGATMSLNNSFQTAFKPQITKSYAHGDTSQMMQLIYDTTRYSFFLVLVCAVPLFFQSSQLLHLWLGSVPEHTDAFCRVMIALCVADTLAAPLWMSAQATGDVKEYFLVVSAILMLNFPLSALALSFGMPPVWPIIIRLLVCCLAWAYRLTFLRRKIKMPLRGYLRNAVWPCLTVLAPTSLAAGAINHYVHLHTVVMSLVLLAVAALGVVTIGMNKHERNFLATAVTQRLKS